jgi:hypothetical protein
MSKFLFAACALAMFTSAAAAQPDAPRAPPPSPPPQSPQLAPTPPVPLQALGCADFRRTPDGMWCPLRSFTIGGETVNPGGCFGPGGHIGGVDIAAQLEMYCPH